VPARELRRSALLASATGLALAVVAVASPASASAGQSVASATPSQLVQQIVGSGVTGVSNVSYLGEPAAAGIFSGMDAVGLSSGIVLSTGRAADVVGPNTVGSQGTANSMPGDPELTALAGATTLDAAILEFDFVPSADTLTFRFVFGSEEYPEYVDTGYTDAFALTVAGTNCAVVPGTTTPITINTINATRNASYYVSVPQNAEATQMDGYTTPLTCTAPVTPGVANHVKLSIADGGDGILDSWVLIESNSFAADTAPTASPVAASTIGGVPVAVTLDGADADGDTLGYSVGTVPVGTVSGTAPNLSYTPPADYSGTVVIPYTVTANGATSETANITVTVAANTAPVAAPQALSTPREAALPLVLTASDAQTPTTLDYSVATPPAHGTLTGTGADLSYTPAAGFSGTDSFTFTASDGVFTSAPATVAITVTEDADPTAAAQNLSTTIGQAIDITLGGDDPESAPLAYTIVTGPGHGTLSGTAPALRYTPDAGYTGADSFTFTVDDGRFTSEAATVTITIAEAPAPAPAPAETLPGTGLTLAPWAVPGAAAVLALGAALLALGTRRRSVRPTAPTT